MPQRDRDRRLRVRQARLVLLAFRLRLLRLLDTAHAGLGEVLVAVGILFGEFQRRLGTRDLRLGRFDLRLLDGRLRIDAADTGFSGRDLRLGLLEGDAVVAFIDLRDHAVRHDVLIVGHRHRSEVTAHLGRHGELARLDVGVVGRFEAPRIVPIEVAGRRDHNEQGHADGDHIRIPLQETRTRLGLLFVFRRRFVV